MSMRTLSRSALFTALLPLVACDASLDAYPTARVEADTEGQGWWWLWPSPDTDDEDDVVEEPELPGDPEWFDAHCDEELCTVRNDFDPAAHLWRAYDLCKEATGLEEGPYFQRLWFETERVYADEFRAADALWTYRFVAPDEDDLWGYRWITCEVDVNGQTVELGDTFASDSLRAMRVDAVLERMNFDLAYALDDLGSWNQVDRGGFQWRIVEDNPELFLADDNDWDSWDATTGDRDW